MVFTQKVIPAYYFSGHVSVAPRVTQTGAVAVTGSVLTQGSTSSDGEADPAVLEAWKLGVFAFPISDVLIFYKYMILFINL